MTIDATRPGPTAVHDALEPAAALIRAYRPARASLFASPRGVLLAEGVAGRVSVAPAADLADRIADLLDGERGAPLALGAIPFDASGRGYLVRPQVVRRGAPSSARTRPAIRATGRGLAGSPAQMTAVPAPGDYAHAAGPTLASSPAQMTAVPAPGDYARAAGPTLAASPAQMTAVPAPEDYAHAVERALAAIRGGSVDKVVLARALDVLAGGPLDLAAIVRRLAERDPNAFTFALDVSDGPERPARTLLGASPELLVARAGDVVRAHPLAGSTRRDADPARDAQLRDALLRSEKDRHEHAVVVDAVADSLRPLCAQLDVPAEPEAVATSTMWHLGSRLEGRLADPSISSLQLALATHPTPAICGTPTQVARRLIATLEPFHRDLYAGAVGWQDASGDGEWAVTIRCGLAQGDAVRLYAGAGIVAGSDAAAELAETTAKLQTLWTALDMSESLA